MRMLHQTARPLTEGDRAVYLEMCREFYHSPAVLHPVPDVYFERTFDQIVSGSPFVKGFLLKKDGVTAGYGLLSVTYSQEAGGEVWWLEELYIRKEFQGQGLGGGFIRYLKSIRPQQVTRFRLELEPENTGAGRLYVREGFSRLGYDQMVTDF